MKQAPVNKITVEHHPAQSKLDTLKVNTWATWRKEVSTFSWTFPEQEIAYILEGECEVTTCCGEKVTFAQGDLVTFPAGFKVNWQVKQALHKRYQLDGNIFTQTFKRIKAALNIH